MLKIIQVGVGGFGRSWTDVVEQSKDWEAVAYVDIDEKALGEAASAHKMPENRCYTSLDQALGEVRADAVLVVVPPRVHAEVAIKALRGGLHVLIEKPLADTMEDAKMTVAEAERRNLKLMVSQNYRFRRGPRTVRRVFETGKVGEPGYAIINFHRAPHFGGFRDKMEHPLLVDMAIHHFDLMRYIFASDPKSLYCETWKPGWSWFDGDPSASATLRMENGLRITYIGSWVSVGWETPWDGDWRIECSEGGIHWSEAVFVKPKESKTKLKENLVSMPLVDRAYSLHEFADAISQDRKPETSGEDNLKSLAMVFAALDSAKSHKQVSLKNYL